MLTTTANFHHSKLPKVGEIGYIVSKITQHNEPCYWNGERQRFQCIAYPLCDNVLPYSIGIHTAIFKRLKGGKEFRFSGHYFDPAE